MPIPQKICVVEDTFTIKGRGLVVMTREWQVGQNISVGDWIELRSIKDERLLARVKSIDSVQRSTQGNTVGLCLAGISRDVVHADDEIWTVDSAD